MKMFLNKVKYTRGAKNLVSNFLRCTNTKMFKQSQYSCRTLSTSGISLHKAAYEGDGKTTVRVINQEIDLGLMIDSYSTVGFRLNNGITVLGPMAIFPRTILSWQVTSANEITEPTLRLFKLLVPNIDLLILGLETNDRKVIDPIFAATKNAKLNVEILPTEHACSTFNFLNAEGRSVAGAMIPPLVISVNEDDLLHSKLHYEDVLQKGFR